MAKWLLIFVMLATLSPRAWGQCVKFEACGLRMPAEGEEIGAAQTMVSPAVGPYYIWLGPGMAVLGMTEKQKTDVDCSIIQMGAYSLRVVGSVQEIMAKMREARESNGDCR